MEQNERKIGRPNASLGPPIRGSANRLLRLMLVAATLLGTGGCLLGVSSPGEPDLLWGRRGRGDGRLQKPRAIAIDDRDQLYIVDMTGRIQVFSADGQFLRGWQTPQIENGRPVGLGFDRDGRLMVADTHYFRVLFYTPEGQWLEDRTIGGRCGNGPGEFSFVTDAVQDSHGNYYVGEYGEYDRIQKFSPDGTYLFEWGGHGNQPGQFVRPQGIAIDKQDRVWVADACNHRIAVFDATGEQASLVAVWGEHGAEPGKLSYPYGIVLDDDGHVYVAEFGNHRVQKFTEDGKSLGTWGTYGRREGELYQPWGLAMDSTGRLHVLDSYNHRVQRIRM